MRKINTLLVANRGEIALRIMRTARALGMQTVAVHSDVDAKAPHVAFADRAIEIGGAAVADSYLRIDRLLDAAREAGADAIHPGYGLLSENAGFARAVVDAGFVFVGPPPGAIEIMGDKAAARTAMLDSGVPCIPGYEGDEQSPEVFSAEADRIGYPVMVKAAAGGGGRGMRLVDDPAALADALQTAASEAEAAFGSGKLILEKAVVNARHVEVQVIADQHGNVVHLGERDCSVQRRHQKVIEEAPCPVMTPELRTAMGDAATEAARAVDYEGAGTVEFLLAGDGSFYFLEMNTRLQVEHPVTELITGTDLVQLQLDVAGGARLPFDQAAVRLDGHAIEVRFCAEDPGQDFLPATGTLARWSAGAGEGVRADSGVTTGSAVSPYYDSMLAKIIAFGPDRETARRRLVRALGETVSHGLVSNRDFLIDALSQPVFAAGEATTAFIGDVYGPDGYQPAAPAADELRAACATLWLVLAEDAFASALDVSPELRNWSSAAPEPWFVGFSVEGTTHHATVRATGRRDQCEIALDDEDVQTCRARLDLDANRVEVVALSGQPVRLDFTRTADTWHFSSAATTFSLTLHRPGQSTEEAVDTGTLRSPMHGQILELAVAVGDRVVAGQKVAVLEAMKMQHELIAGVDGAIAELCVEAGTQVAAGDRILEIEGDEDAAG